MRNLVLLKDSTFSGFTDDNEIAYPDIVSLCRDIGSTSIFALTKNGCLCGMEVSDTLRFESRILLSGDDVVDNSWFNATVVSEIGAVVCISHSGMIVSVREDPETGRQSNTFEVEGDVEGGIATACWNPDASNIVIITNNDSILLMTGYWDVLEEVPLPSRLVGSPCSVSWRGDGEFLSVLTIDKEDSIPHVRVYSKKLELISVGKNVAEGPAGVLKGLGSAIAYATNGSLIALSQQKTRSNQQIVFIEKNGLRHLEFDIQVRPQASVVFFLFLDFANNLLPLRINQTVITLNHYLYNMVVLISKLSICFFCLKCPPLSSGFEEWKVTTLHWDLPSTLLAVGLTTINR